jgi:signal transduction histidine kinase
MIIWRNSQLLDQQGAVAGTVSFGIDVTEIAAAEKRAESLEERLRQAEKLEALGQLAGGVAHDFNNLLLAIRGYGEAALSGLEQGVDDVADNIGTMMSACDQAGGLTKQLLAFGRTQVLIPQVLDLNDVVEETVALLARLIGDNVEIVSLLADEPVLVNADRGQIAQVITNLAINARDAMQNGGVMTIRVGTAARDDDLPGRLAVLGVSDDGCGIDAATAARVFEPFFTTKGDEGNGLGLATVYGIVAQSGGEIALETDVGRGTTFTVFLPVCDEDLPTLAPVPVIGEARGTETILLVEDDPTVRSIVSTMLVAHGYKVVSAASGSEALELFGASGESIHVVVSDLIMHGLSGRQTIDGIRALAPATKGLYMSGYTDDFTIGSGTLDPGTGFIQKPFSGAQLAGAVRQLLDAGPIRRIA